VSVASVPLPAAEGPLLGTVVPPPSSPLAPTCQTPLIPFSSFLSKASFPAVTAELGSPPPWRSIVCPLRPRHETSACRPLDSPCEHHPHREMTSSSYFNNSPPRVHNALTSPPHSLPPVRVLSVSHFVEGLHGAADSSNPASSTTDDRRSPPSRCHPSTLLPPHC
jgi:hypothetical protein